MAVLAAALRDEIEQIQSPVAVDGVCPHTSSGEMHWPPTLKPVDLSVQTRARAAGSVAINARLQRRQPRSCAKRPGSRSRAVPRGDRCGTPPSSESKPPR